MTLELLQAVLPDFPDPDTLEYMVGMLDEGDSDDLEDGLLEFLEDYAGDEEAARVLVKTIRSKMFGTDQSAPSSAVVAAAEEPTKLANAIVMASKANEAADAVAAQMELLMGPVEINSNETIVNFDTGAPKHETPEDMMLRLRKAKKDKRTEKRRIISEHKAAPMRNAIMEKLTQQPVVIHGMVDEEGNYGGNPAVDIVLTDFSIDLGGISLLEDTNLTLVYGRRYGLIGRNGSGKTTFLKYLAAKQIEGIPWYIQILHISQEIPGGNMSALDTLLSCDVERDALLKEKAIIEGDDDDDDTSGVDGEKSEHAKFLQAAGMDEGLDPTERLVDIYDRLDEIDADLAEPKAARILAGLSFTDSMMRQPTSSLSGGWRMRVSLARALFIEPDVLLLDEPTNHLDLHAVVWLETYLRTYTKSLICVSHARDFLNEIATDIIELDKKKVNRFKGDFDTFEQTKAEGDKRLDAERESGTKERSKLQALVNKNIGGGSKAANMAKSRQKMLDKLTVYEKATPKECVVKFKIPNPGPVAGGFGIRLVGVGFHYPDQPSLFSGVEFSINQNSRICLVGPNGIGKSTLLNVIYEELEPTVGMVTRNQRLKVERFSQHHVDNLTMKVSILEHMAKLYPKDPPQKIRQHLGQMGVVGDIQIRPVFTLSGGQKSRVAMAMITYTEPHLLLLDEPTNHLDLDTVQGLIRALANFQGGVLVVSHDEHLITAVCDELWIIGNKKVTLSRSDFQQYKRSVVESFHKGEQHEATKDR